MGVRINQNGSERLKREIPERLKRNTKLAALYFHRALRRAVQISNRKGEEPSRPGESPRSSQFKWLLQNIVIERVDEWTYRVGVRKGAKYGLWLELGTGAYIIRAKPGKKLRLFLTASRAKSLGQEGLKKLGATLVTDPKDGRTKWAIFRSVVHHPGIRPRPFFRPTLRREMRVLLRILAGGLVI